MGPGIFQTGSPWGHLWRISMAVFAATWALAIAAALTAAALADKDVSAAEISRHLGVSRNTVYRYLGPGWKRRTKAEAHQPAAGVADAAGHDLTDQPARLDRGP